MSHPLNLVPRVWRAIDRIPRFPSRRTPNFSIASKVGELMQKRFGGLAVCGTCAWRHRAVLARFGYYRHPDITFRGNACDFCEQVYDSLALWPTEEHRYPTQQEYADQARAGLQRESHADDRRRVIAWSR